MLIGYDFFDSGLYNEDNDGLFFDTQYSIEYINTVKYQNINMDATELLISFDANLDMDTTLKKWIYHTVFFADFNNNLIAGNINMGTDSIEYYIIQKRIQGDTNWINCAKIAVEDNKYQYVFNDMFVCSEVTYEYRVLPARYVNNLAIYGDATEENSVFVEFDHGHIFDAVESYDMIYNLKFGAITDNISGNKVETLSGQYPYFSFGQQEYLSGSGTFTLVTEESATGLVNLKTERILRNNVKNFLNNKKPKILKNSDGQYMLIQIGDNPTMTPSEIIGIYEVSFDFTEIGDINDINTLIDNGLVDDIT